MIKRATSRRLGAEPAHDHVLLGIEQLAPFGVAAGDGKLGFHLKVPAPHLTAPAKNILGSIYNKASPGTKKQFGQIARTWIFVSALS
jgi:hypothetical protein